MNFRFLTALAAVVALSISTASAADLPAKAYVKAPPMLPAWTWTGFYAGVSAGYHDGTFTQSDCVGACPPAGASMKHGFISVQAGADYQFQNNVVLGAFVSLPVTRMKANVDTVPVSFGLFEVKPRVAGVAAARLGYAYGAFLPYAFVGAGFADVRITSPFGPAPTNTHVGVAFGAGLEYRLAQHWSVDFQYTRIDIPKEAYDFGGGVERFGETSNNYKVGINYRF
jgi:outer membrane immunogenic protein